MIQERKHTQPNAYVFIALCAGGASAVIAFLALITLHQITDAGMWAVAAMVAAPSAMGAAIAYFMSKRPLPD